MITNKKDNMLLAMADEINELLRDIENKEHIKQKINSLFGIYNVLSYSSIFTPIVQLKTGNVTINQDNFMEILFDLQKDIFRSLEHGLDNIYIINKKKTNRERIENVIGQLYGYLTNYISDTIIKNKEVKVMKHFNITLNYSKKSRIAI
jgi:ribosomal protein L23